MTETAPSDWQIPRLSRFGTALHQEKMAGVGASVLLDDGHIDIKTGQIDHAEQNSVATTDSAPLPVDLIVPATGYSSRNGCPGRLISQQVLHTS